jgi:hypothetical protein
MTTEVLAANLTPGDIVMLKHGAAAVKNITIYPLLTASQTARMVDVFFFDQSYPLYFREDMEVEVIKHINVEAIQYAVEELSKP